MENYIGALLLTLFAGLSTGIGGLVVFFSDIKNDRFLAFSMAFAAGVMLYVSFVEMLPDAQNHLCLDEVYGTKMGGLLSIFLFFIGMLLVYLLDKFLPSIFTNESSSHVSVKNKKGLYKTGVLVALALAIHNFPEGIATYLAGINDFNLGVSIAIAIALHNIPEGISVASPIYYATGNKWKAFKYSLFSGLAEPLGALLIFFIIGNSVSDIILSCCFALIAGIMVFISLDCLLLSSWELKRRKDSLLGLTVGMFIMALSLVIA